VSGYEIPDEAIDAADHIYGGQIPDNGLRQIIGEALPFILPGEIAEAEKRGAVKALRFAAEVAKRSAAEVAAATGTPGVEGVVLGLAQGIEEYADQIKSGEVTL
jgi:hypothetical protein